jgi:molecular chaperone GrpE
MTEPDATNDLLHRLEAVVAEIRRQGRASIAAQAAAESCLESVQALRDEVACALADRDGAGAEAAETDDGVEPVVTALLPFADALERLERQAARMAADAPRRSLLARLVGAPDTAHSLRTLSEGVRLLRAQLDDLLGSLDVEIDRRLGARVDPEAHRVVEVRPARDAEAPDTVVEIVRAGYVVGGRRVREADVVATTAARASLKS